MSIPQRRALKLQALLVPCIKACGRFCESAACRPCMRRHASASLDSSSERTRVRTLLCHESQRVVHLSGACCRRISQTRLTWTAVNVCKMTVWISCFPNSPVEMTLGSRPVFIQSVQRGSNVYYATQFCVRLKNNNCSVHLQSQCLWLHRVQSVDR